MPRSFTLRQRLRYRFDRVMSRGTVAAIVWLFAISSAVILAIAGLLISLGLAPRRADGQPVGYWELAWNGLMRTLDPGAMSHDSGTAGYLLAMLAITICGIFSIGTLIGLLSNAIARRVDELRKGRSPIIEEGHVVLLGWSRHSIPLIAELVLAARGKNHDSIAVLADRDKVEMEDEIRAKIGSTGSVRISCRTGRPEDLEDLLIVGPDTARSVVVVSESGPEGDAEVLRVLLALSELPHRPQAWRITAAVREPANVPATALFAPGEVFLVDEDDTIARVVVQACRQLGLAEVYAELLDFSRNDIHFRPAPMLTGRTFHEALFAFHNASPIGLRRADGTVLLNPARGERFAAGDQVIAVMAAGDPLRLADGAPSIAADAMREVPWASPIPERTLILGWNARGPQVLRQLDTYVPARSHAVAVSRRASLAGEVAALGRELKHLSVEAQSADLRDRAAVVALPLKSFHQIVVLADDSGEPPAARDAATLVTLLHLRAALPADGPRPWILSEVLDVRHRHLAVAASPDDYVVSDSLVSMMLAQVATNPDSKAVFDELLDCHGSEIYIRPADSYVTPGRPVSFATLIESASLRREVAIGYQLASRREAVRMNPTRDEVVTFAEGDRVVVVALE